MIYLDHKLLIGWDISVLHREAKHAAKQYHEERYRGVRRWFEAVAEAVRVERERRAGEGPQSYPVVIKWEPNPDIPRSASDLELDLVLAQTTVVRDVRREDARELRNVWHDLLVQLAELRDQRRHERSIGQIVYGPIRSWTDGPEAA